MMTKIAMTMMAMTTTKTCRLGVDHDDTVWRGSAQMIEALVVDFAESNHGPPDSILIFRYPCPTLNPGFGFGVVDQSWWSGDRDGVSESQFAHCLLYTSDAADDM
eukprot:2082210-Rhodomonas_salina.3